MEAEYADSDKLLKYTGYVQGNCEFLCHIRNIISQKSRTQRDCFKTLDVYMQDICKSQNKIELHFEALLQLIIQLAYFLYSCKNFGKSPVIQLEDIRVQEIFIKVGQKRFNIIIYYKLSDENIEDMFGCQVFKSIMYHIQQTIRPYIQAQKESVQNTKSAISFHQVAFETFWEQFQQLAQNEQLAQDQVKFFLYLEQTSLFYEYSILYRIRTCSLLDYIKTNPTNLEIFKEFKSKEENLINNYNQQKKRSKQNPQILRAKQKEIDNNLLSFFQKINQKNVQLVPQSQKSQVCRVKFTFKLKQKQKKSFQSMMAHMQDQSIVNEQGEKGFRRPLAELEYFVQYSSEKNSIQVRLYMPSIKVDALTSDFLMFQSNVLTFDSANVSIQLDQPKRKAGGQVEEDQKVSKKVNKESAALEKQKKVNKVVIFKGISNFHTNDPPIQKVLLLMDITMIASRIYEPEMNSQKHSQGGGKQSYLKLNNVTKKVSHYTKLFMKCAKQVYDY